MLSTPVRKYFVNASMSSCGEVSLKLQHNSIAPIYLCVGVFLLLRFSDKSLLVNTRQLLAFTQQNEACLRR